MNRELVEKRMSFSPIVCSTCFVLMILSLLITLSAPTCLSALSITRSTLPNELQSTHHAIQREEANETEEACCKVSIHTKRTIMLDINKLQLYLNEAERGGGERVKIF